ncbi:TetR/AcrR family transcriptional regulator [Sphaerisporangium krabiense]|uniref:AcrR family transcriptional regulator n=1 Tax=Sphaerisporangium krabiense TaxID=763782 RepID=A0A7W8ZB10_9ACTN|nr:TetR/AcrR family transcriptional regulator [Sphaerisporangium krabiense]MBB5630358.1 AcrR family transcriptional regulator [Sphaerisporangium krabiense]
MHDGRRLRGQRSREAILERAVALASVDGLGGLTLARLAEAAGVSKSGFFAHWRDKEQLQLDCVAWARRLWEERVIAPTATAPKGLRRLFALHESRLAFYSDGVLPGGCFFFVAQVEFDDRPGPVRDAVAAAMGDWLGYLERRVKDAVDLGELTADPAQLAYEIEALGEATVTHARMRSGDAAYRRARTAVLDRLRALATDPSILPED